MKLSGLFEIGPFMPKTASSNVWPGFASRVRITRFGALKPFTAWPPACPSMSGSFPSTHTSA